MIDPLEFIREIVAISSLSGEERGVAEHITRRMADWGFDEATIDPAGNAVGIRQNGEPLREIVLLGHMDTVPGDIPVRVEDGLLYGRGSVDAKGALAAFVAAAAQADLPTGTRLVVIGATEEESATSKGARWARENYRPDLCIIGEPSGWDGITLGYKGRLLLDYHLAQEMGHTAGPESAAAEAAVDFWQDLSAYCSRYNTDRPRLFEQILPSIRHIETSSDGLMNRVDLKLGFRLPPGFEVEELITLAQAKAAEATIQFRGHEKAYQTGRSNRLYRAFSTAIRAQGGRPVPKLKTGTSDMNVVGPQWGCPIVAYGPGDSKLDHTPHEHLVLDEYLRSIEVLKIVLENLD